MGSIANKILNFQDAMQKELGEYESLFSQLHSSKSRENRSNWENINTQFSKRYQTEVEFDRNFHDLSTQAPTDQKLVDAFRQFKETALSHQMKIWQRLKETSGGLPEYTIHVQTGETPSSLPVRVLKGLYNHSGKIAFVASALIIASQTEMGAKVLSDVGQKIISSSYQLYNPAKDAVLQSAQKMAEFAKENVAEIGSVLSGFWAVPAALRAGWKKGSLILLVGAASAALPHVLKPNFSWAATLEKAKTLGSFAIASATQFLNQRMGAAEL